MQFRVKEFREAAGLTQVELAKKSGISRATICSLESGEETVVNTATLSKIAKALGKKVSDIFFD